MISRRSFPRTRPVCRSAICRCSWSRKRVTRARCWATWRAPIRTGKHAWSDRAEVLAIFHGPHGYVSPSWYQPDPVVPTWNYAVVHLHGTARLVHEPAELKALVARLVQRHEAGRTPAWNMALPADDEAKMLAAIVGFEITITRIEAKFKLSQNRSAADREGVVKALEAGGGEAERQLAQLMRDISTDKSS